MVLHYKNLSLQNISGEKWKDIPGYEGFYKCSNKGRIKSMPSVGTGKKENILKQTLKSDTGYLIVNLYKNGIDGHLRVHRAVGKAFLRNPLKKRTINHKDTIKVNNNLVNLEWATHSEQHLHAYQNGRVPAFLGITGKDHHSSKPVNQYTKNGVLIASFESGRDAAQKTGISNGHIASVCTGKRISTGGYKWAHV